VFMEVHVLPESHTAPGYAPDGRMAPSVRGKRPYRLGYPPPISEKWASNSTVNFSGRSPFRLRRMYCVDGNWLCPFSAGMLRRNRFPAYSATSMVLDPFPPGPFRLHLMGNSPTSVSLKSSKKITLSPGMKSYFE